MEEFDRRLADELDRVTEDDCLKIRNKTWMDLVMKHLMESCKKIEVMK